MAVIYSKLGGCLGVTAKLGPLASRDLCAGVKGLLERLITHFGLGSSKGEEPCGVYAYRGRTLLLVKHCPGVIPFREQCCLHGRPC